MTNNHENSINLTNMKLKDLNIFELFKSDDNDEEQEDTGTNLIEKLEKLNSKLKLNSQKMSKVDETNVKLVKETQNIKNAQDMNKRNILLNKQSIEELNSKIAELEKKLNPDPTQMATNIRTQSPENISSNIKEKQKHLTQIKKTKNNLFNEDTSSFQYEKNLEVNKDLEKKVKEINKRLNELDKLTKKFSTIDSVYELKNDLNDTKKSLNKFATNSDLKAIYNKSEENEKEIKYIKTQIEDFENNLELKDEFKSVKKKVELFHNRIEKLENNERTFKKNLDTEINERTNLNEKIYSLLEIKTFENLKSQLTKEFSNINANFIHTRKLLDEIIDSMKEKVSYNDIKILEKDFEARLENMNLNCIKKFAEKSDTIKSFKYIEQQIKSVFEILQKRAGENDGWLIAKKPLNLNLCASCESYLGDLKDNNPYIPWNKYPLRDSNDKLYRLGNGYSKMLQMVNIEENEKKNISSVGLGMNFKEEIGNLIKKTKNDKNDLSELNGDITFGNNFNKTMGYYSIKSPKNNFPLIKKKILAKNKSDLNDLDEIKDEESKKRRNKINNELNNNNNKVTMNSGTNTDNKDDEFEEQAIITTPKITKIIKKNKI